MEPFTSGIRENTALTPNLYTITIPTIQPVYTSRSPNSQPAELTTPADSGAPFEPSLASADLLGLLTNTLPVLP